MSIVPRRHAHEIVLNGASRYGNPFSDVEIEGEFTAPDGRVLRHPAFYDGGDVWKLRFSPDMEGTWHYTIRTMPEDSDLAAQRGKFEVGPSDSRGFLQSVPGSLTGFRFENGEDIYLLGDTTYDLFGMDYCGGNVEGFAKRRAAQGYNFLRIRLPVSRFHPPIAYSHWQTKRCWPWGGSEQAPRFDQFNLDYFASVDRTLKTLEEAGLGVEMIMEAWGQEFPFNTRSVFTAEWEMHWMRFLIARYGASSNVFFWTPLNEFEYYPRGERKPTSSANRWALRISRFIKGTDAHPHPVVMHNSPVVPPFAERFKADPGAVDTIMFQNWGARDAAGCWLGLGIEEQIEESLGGWWGTAVFAEWGYERSEDEEPLFPAFKYCDRSHNRRGGWRGAFCGLSIANGFEYTWSPTMRLDEDMPGAADLAHIGSFMRKLIGYGPVRAKKLALGDYQQGRRPLILVGQQAAAVYLPVGGEVLVDLPGQWRLRWYEVKTGTFGEAVAVEAGAGGLKLTAPAGEDSKSRPLDWACLLERV